MPQSYIRLELLLLKKMLEILVPQFPFIVNNIYTIATAPTIDPITPGIPCKLWIPHVSCKLKYFSNNGDTKVKPITEIIPIQAPKTWDATGLKTTQATPTATPPKNIIY
jgi:hypothetical protein